MISCAASASSVTAFTVRSGRSSIAREPGRALLTLLFQRERFDAAHAEERGLRGGEHDREEEQQNDRGNGDEVGAHDQVA